MIQCFPYVAASVERGPFSQVRTVVESFQKTLKTGLVAFEWSESQAILLFVEGQVVGGELLHNHTCKKITLDELWLYGEGGKAPTVLARAVSLPAQSVHTRQAVRALKRALEWYPPQQSLAFEGPAATAALNQAVNAAAYGRDGLLHLIWQDAEGYILLLGGSPAASEAVFITGSTFESGAAALQKAVAPRSGALTLEFYAAGPATSAYQQVMLQKALAQLLQGIFARYQKLVGSNLTTALGAEINHLLQAKKYYLEFVGNQLIDTHVFASGGAAIQVYRSLFKIILEHIVDVIGAGLTSSIVMEVFKSLQSEDQQTIRESPLMLMILAAR